MAEQIRKYLIIPQIVIIMAVKIEQLEMCVEENTIADFKGIVGMVKQSVREKGQEQEEFKVDQRYAELVYQVQNKMIAQLTRDSIAIETNPSSNYLIGTIQKYDEHPILRFNSRKLRTPEKNMSLSVSINTDDQGVFDTLLENEYALMTLALKKSKDKDNQPLYDIEDIYEWVDYVREMGLEQSFK